MNYIIFNEKVFGEPQIPLFPNKISFYRLYISSCSKTVKFKNTVLFETNCDVNGWCKYKYEYTYVLDNNSMLKLKQIIYQDWTAGFIPCPSNTYPPVPTECYPQDCKFIFGLHYPVPDINIPVTLPDEMFYESYKPQD